MRKGYVQIYTGDGKGKTTAAIGLAVRAAGAGLKVFFAQFIKNKRCSEHLGLERFADLVKVKQYGTGFIRGKVSPKTRAAIQRGLDEVRQIVERGDFDVVILDEINVAIKKGLLPVEEVIEVINSRRAKVEIVLTGRDAHPEIIRLADLVTEMKKIKHYMDRGVRARVGIER